MTLYHKATLS